MKRQGPQGLWRFRLPENAPAERAGQAGSTYLSGFAVVRSEQSRNLDPESGQL
jgi:hypothetical protein